VFSRPPTGRAPTGYVIVVTSGGVPLRIGGPGKHVPVSLDIGWYDVEGRPVDPGAVHLQLSVRRCENDAREEAEVPRAHRFSDNRQ